VTSLTTSRDVRDTIAELESIPALRMLARQTRAGLVVSGSYFKDGDDIVVQAHVTDARRNQVLAATEPVRGPIANPGAVLDAVREHVVGSLALHLDARLATIMAEGLSPTYEAYEAFISGLEIFTTGHTPEAAPYFERAYALDSTFVDPLIWEAFAVGAVKRDSIVGVLERHRASLSQIDRYALDYHKATVSGSQEERLAAARRAAQLAPGSHWTHNVATALAALGRTNEAIDVWATIDRKHSWVATWPGFWIGYVQALHVARRHREELQIASEAHQALPSNYNLQAYEAIALAMNREWTKLDERLREIEQRTNAGWEFRFIAAELRLHGDDARARLVDARSLRWYAERAAGGSHDLGFKHDRATALYAAGRWSEAGALIDSLRAENVRDRQWVTLAALIEGRIGNRTRARDVLDSLASSAAGPNADAQLADAARIAAVLGQRERAIELLERAHGHPNVAWRHYTFNAFDFDSLTGTAALKRLTAGR
jgi:tetratricopeptide (TPR) repeat protein